MKRVLLSSVAALAMGAGLAFGQFGFGITVFDPSVYAEAVSQVANLVKQYNQLVQTYQMVTNQYNQMLWMAKTLPGNLARFRTVPTPWFLSRATNTYGATGGWIAAINTGSNAPAGYRQAAERLLPYGAALSSVPADQVDRLQKHYATIELTDGANENGIETVGTLRSNAPEVQAAIQSLENDSLNSDPSYNTEIAVLEQDQCGERHRVAQRAGYEQAVGRLGGAATHRCQTQARRRSESHQHPYPTRRPGPGDSQWASHRTGRPPCSTTVCSSRPRSTTRTTD